MEGAVPEEVRGIDSARVSAWLAANLDGARAPFAFELIAAGGSNLTYRVTDANGRSVALRRPPVAARIATAHDMAREWKILAALSRPASPVPVPAALAFCGDEGVNCAPFYVMSFVEGLILRDAAQAAALGAAQKERATEALIETQAALHTLDVDALGLGDLARQRASYVERQLARWRKQAEASTTRAVPHMAEVHARLARAIPPEIARPGLAHGDYRFDNVVMDGAQRVIAVLDWELCTIGDPIADFCWSLMYWAAPGEANPWLQNPPTQAPGFCSRAEVAARYAKRTGFDLSRLPYYEAFSWWKMACLIEGVAARARAGASGGMKSGPHEQIQERADTYFARAEELSRHL
jgi:aminoglycoside phosphotransferase (APT) family kinase protein